MAPRIPNDARAPIGHTWLQRELVLRAPPPAVESYVVPGARRTEVNGSRTVESYPHQYRPDDTVAAHLKFALRYEPVDLGILVAAFRAMNPAELEDWVRREPTGAFSRRAWFLYETFAGRGTLDLEDARFGNYVEALDPERHVVAARLNSKRHRVADNLLGGPGLCPVVRRTARLTEQMSLRVDTEARALIESYDAVTLARAVSYLYTKETRSSFAIEGETPNTNRTERFAAILKSAPEFEPALKHNLIRLQGEIVDSRYAARDWRDFQNFVGAATNYREEVHFICPRPDDVASLMVGWVHLTQRMIHGQVDPVTAAAVAAFAFVFVHPFEDGNGRIHRFLMHYVLAKTGFSPRGFIFPVSAAIIRDRQGYDAVLESFSRPIQEFVDWSWTAEKEVAVANETADLYRYFDATLFAEYLYDRVADTVHKDLKDELGFVAVFDRAFEAVREIVDMPDRRASLLVRLCMQNGGRLSAVKRSQFSEITEAEIAAMEAAVQTAIAEVSAEHP